MGLMLTGCKKKPPETDPTEATQAALGVRSVRPAEGRNDQQTRITIAGSGFQPGVKVFIGDTPAQNVAVNDSSTLAATVPEGLVPNEYVVAVRNPDGKEATLPRGFKVVAGEPAGTPKCDIEIAYFEFDQSALTEPSRDALQRSVDCLKSRGVKKVRVEGHADERGSTDYNLALGQRRAESVRGYLNNFGFSSSDVTTISYGEERPVASGSDEESWSKNRRAEIVIVE